MGLQALKHKDKLKMLLEEMLHNCRGVNSEVIVNICNNWFSLGSNQSEQILVLE